MAEYIEREALLRSLVELGYTICDKWNGIRDVILAEDSADVVPVVHGRWVYDEHEMECSCSVCLHEAPVGMTTYYTTNYCPNCGARMDGGNEDG